MLRISFTWLMLAFLFSVPGFAVEISYSNGAVVKYHGTFSITSPTVGQWYRFIICDTFGTVIDSTHVEYQNANSWPYFADPMIPSNNYIGYGTYLIKVKTAGSLTALNNASTGTGRTITLSFSEALNNTQCDKTVNYHSPVNITSPNNLRYDGFRAYFYDQSNDSCWGYLEILTPYSGSWGFYLQLKDCSSGTSAGYLSFSTNYNVVISGQDQLGTWLAGKDTCGLSLGYFLGLTSSECDHWDVNYESAMQPSNTFTTRYQAYRYNYYDFFSGSCIAEFTQSLPSGAFPTFSSSGYECGTSTPINLSINGQYKVVISAQDFNANWFQSPDTCYVGFYGCPTFSLSGNIIHPTCELSNGSIDLSTVNGTAPFSYAWSNSETSQDIDSIGAGTYSVTVIDDNGCIDSLSFNLVNSGNAINIIPAYTVTLSIPLNAWASVLWSNNLNGTTYTTGSIEVSPNGAQWQAAVLDTLCGDTTLCFEVPDLSSWTGLCAGSKPAVQGQGNAAGYGESTVLSDVHIYPNPVDDELFIELNGWSNVQLEINDLSGKVMIRQVLSGHSRNTINVQGLPSGIYLLSLSNTTGNNTYVTKVVLQ